MSVQRWLDGLYAAAGELHRLFQELNHPLQELHPLLRDFPELPLVLFVEPDPWPPIVEHTA